MAIYPGVGGAKIITQSPYTSKMSYETVTIDMDSGPRFTFPRRGVPISGYPADPLFKFNVQYSNITDTEAETLESFFVDQKGRWKAFGFLDPNGNLLQYSEDFSQSYWDKSAGVSVGAGVADPFNSTVNRATALTGASNASMSAIVGPNTGGLNGHVICASAWVNARDSNKTMAIGVLDDATLTYTEWNTPYDRWMRIHHAALIQSTGTVKFVLGGNSTWSGRIVYVFGAQASPMKGPGGYAKTPGNYGYHANCRFDTDRFDRQRIGPNQNSLSLPVVEFNL